MSPIWGKPIGKRAWVPTTQCPVKSKLSKFDLTTDAEYVANLVVLNVSMWF